jgi:hypothetical protein
MMMNMDGITAADDGRVMVWNLYTGESICSCIALMKKIENNINRRDDLIVDGTVLYMIGTVIYSKVNWP